MRILLKLLGGLFLLCLTLIILGYTSMFVLLNTATFQQIHEDIPALGYIGSFIGTYDPSYQYDDVYQQKKRIGSSLEGFVKRKQSGDAPITKDGDRLELTDTRSEIALYSPHWTFAGQVSSGVQSLQLIYTHKGRDITRIYDIPWERGGTFYTWSYDVHLGKETLFNGVNEYLIEATYPDGRVITRKVTLQIAYERIAVDDTIMYVDTSYIPADESQDILWEAPDFEGVMTNFMTYGCDPEKKALPLLIQKDFQYMTIPACLTFSYEKNYMLWFSFKERTLTSYLYDIVSPQGGILYHAYPLFTYDLHTTFFSLVFRDASRQRLKILSSQGDQLSYVLEILYYDVQRKRKVVSVSHIDGAQLMVENEKEKMYIYMYKQWDNFRSLLFPGVRYQFWYRGAQINQGPMYSLPLRLYGPQRSAGPTFRFDVSLDGTRLYIDDGIKRMSFDILLIGKTIEVEDSTHKLNQPGVCDTVQVEIYQNTRGDDLEGARVRDTLWMVGKGFDVSSLQVFHNGKRTPVEVEQFYQGWFHYRLSAEKESLERGKNTYKIVGYNERGRQVCTIEKEITVK